MSLTQRRRQFRHVVPGQRYSGSLPLHLALAENAVHNGAEYHLNCAFTGETRQADGTHLLHTTRGDFTPAGW